MGNFGNCIISNCMPFSFSILTEIQLFKCQSTLFVFINIKKSDFSLWLFLGWRCFCVERGVCDLARAPLWWLDAAAAAAPNSILLLLLPLLLSSPSHSAFFLVFVSPSSCTLHAVHLAVGPPRPILFLFDLLLYLSPASQPVSVAAVVALFAVEHETRFIDSVINRTRPSDNFLFFLLSFLHFPHPFDRLKKKSARVHPIRPQRSSLTTCRAANRPLPSVSRSFGQQKKNK